jgi:RNA 2',3'-cyclic 3'-phosphodiesterase
MDGAKMAVSSSVNVPKKNFSDSLFFAVVPEEKAADGIAELSARLRMQFGLRANPIPIDRLHMTLRYIGAFNGLPAHIVEQARAAAASIALPPADITLDRIETFASRRAKHPIVLSGDASDSLSALEFQLAKALTENGIALKRRPHFKPHVTLFYDTRHIPKSAIAPITWQATHFTLIHSHLGQSRYETLMTWPLNS